MPHIWPCWSRSIGAMLASSATVRFACLGCRRIFDVDLAALAILRGAEWGLIGWRARCKASKCRARGLFVAAPCDPARGDARFSPFQLLDEKAAMPPSAPPDSLREYDETLSREQEVDAARITQRLYVNFSARLL